MNNNLSMINDQLSMITMLGDSPLERGRGVLMIHNRNMPSLQIQKHLLQPLFYQYVIPTRFFNTK